MAEREIKEIALVLSSTSSGEADRIITLLSAERGKYRAKIKGVKKPRAKLAYASFPLNLGEYLLVKSGKNYVVTNCNYIDNFSILSHDLNKYYAACGILDIVSKTTRESEECAGLFVATIDALRQLCYSNENLFEVLCKYIHNVINFSGFRITEEVGYASSKKSYFDFSTAQLTNVLSENAVELSDNEAYILNCVINHLKVGEDKIKGIKNVLKLLIMFFETKLDEDIEIVKKFIEG